ncbi:MAG: type I-C CRISPR-associated protein Cas5c [Methanomassiliicoccaceae archaeon]|nr:type I-C CRISPR-associated protein Cas5c [Methanomassiliicoccaceae archaeon]
MENKVYVRVSGRRAMFTDPITKIGGEKGSYPIPTYESLRGIMDSIYWKPTFVWVIDKVRIINPIKNETVNVRTIKYHSTSGDLYIYNYLRDVEYEIEAHFEWNLNNKAMENDRNDNKHFFSAKRMIEKGGHLDVFLGTRECPAIVEPCEEFGRKDSAYKNTQKFEFGLMFHGFDYLGPNGEDILTARFWKPVMINGTIDFPRPDDGSLMIKRVRGTEYAPRAASEEVA